MADLNDPYHDEETPDIDSGSLKDGNATGTGGMKPMHIGVEFTDELREASLWKAKLAAFLSVLFVAIGCVLTRTHRANYYYASRHRANVCDGFNADYFAQVMHQVQRAESAFLCAGGIYDEDRECRCPNPFQPIARDRAGWDLAMQQNVDILNSNYSSIDKEPDFVLYGDSITERLLGRNFGRYYSQNQGRADVTYETFTKEGGGKLNGLPMGISGDEVAQLLYRMQNGEMPESLNPKLWWILIGTNDLAYGCSGDVILAGNIRILQEIRHRHESHNHATDAPIVFNSILPRGSEDLVGENNAMWEILRDVNQRLECYATITPDVYFANTTDIFTEKGNGGGIFIRKEYFDADSLHPSVEGSRVWEEFIVEKALALLT